MLGSGPGAGVRLSPPRAEWTSFLSVLLCSPDLPGQPRGLKEIYPVDVLHYPGGLEHFD